MTDRQIDFLIAGADPIDLQRLDGPSLGSAAAELRDAITAEAGAPARPPRFRMPWAGRSLARRAVVVGLAGAACLGIAAFIGVNQLGDPAQPAWAAPLIRAAEASPRFLVGEDGWKIVRADQFGADTGEMLYARGSETAQLAWLPKTRRPIDRPTAANEGITLPATSYSDSRVVVTGIGTNRYRAAWHQGKWTLELDSEGVTRERLGEILSAMHPVGIDDWLSAMPASAVRPESRSVAVDEMLTDIPLPPNFDVAALREGQGLVKERYQLGAEVTTAVTCGWVGQWLEGRSSGDSARERKAVAAMTTSHDWAILKEMSEKGGWSSYIWSIADAMPTNADLPAGHSGFKIADSYGIEPNGDGSMGCKAP
jgi:hypothetical protein